MEKLCKCGCKCNRLARGLAPRLHPSVEIGATLLVWLAIMYSRRLATAVFDINHNNLCMVACIRFFIGN